MDYDEDVDDDDNDITAMMRASKPVNISSNWCEMGGEQSGRNSFSQNMTLVTLVTSI